MQHGLDIMENILLVDFFVLVMSAELVQAQVGDVVYAVALQPKISIL